MTQPTLNTKYGRVTGREWIRRRFYAEFDDWLTPSALHYIFTRTPAVDANGVPITDADFEHIARYHQHAAHNQLISEAKAFFAALPERDRRRADYAALQREQSRAAVKAHVTSARRRKHSATPLLPGL
jgi:hypothetical protein